MAKRFADSQITRETFKENDSGSDDDKSGHTTASAAVMSKRKIAMPKRKMASFQNTQSEPLVKKVDAPANTFSFLKNSKTLDGDIDKNAKLKALNLQFRDKIVSSVGVDPCADLSPICDKYKAFIQSFNTPDQLPAQKQPTESQKSPAQQQSVEVQESSDEDEEKEVKVEGPKFTINTKPPTSDSVFSFGAKREAQKDDDDSDSDAVEIKGPQFTFSGTVKSDVFKLSTSSKKETGAGSVTAPVETKAAPAFSFGATASSNAPKEKPSFTFGAPAAKESEPATEQKKDEKENTKPKFDFSFAANKSTSNGATETKKPSFAFAFGASHESKDAVSDKPATPSFSFGKPSQDSEKKADAKPAFSFGNPTQDSNKPENKPAFSFGKPSQDSETKAEAKPAFAFGKPSQDQENKTEAKPAFSFGAPNSSTAPSFTFGKPEAKTEQSKTPEAIYGAKNGFKFALPFEKKPAESETDKKQEVLNPSTEEAGDNEPQEESKPIDLQNGEEGESPLFSQRSKLMIFNSETKGYDSRGVGEMKLLQSKEDKTKVRFLCRSDGMGNILLNTRVVKDFTYAPLTAENENLIKVPVIEADNKLVTYVVKFKQKADGRQFVKAIEDVKKDL